MAIIKLFLKTRGFCDSQCEHPSIPAFLNKEDFAELKNDLGKYVFDNAMKFMTDSIYCGQNNKGVQFKESKHVVKIVINLKSENVHVDFYADKFVSENLPEGYQTALNSITKTQKAALNVALDQCLKREVGLGYA